mmetsp:Transcript_31196/g.74456  ORF Transcript_31196/g.74456 Transcript_31196/m.74456 type:complete len:296 (-) Transcript_31196:145-1032(-)
MRPLVREVAEPGVHGHVLVGLQERDRLLHVRHLARRVQPLRRGRVRAGDLCHPHGLVENAVPVQVVLQAPGVAGEHVQADGVHFAALAGGEELVQPFDGVHGRMVVHGGRHDGGDVVVLRQLLHLCPPRGRLGRQQVRLVREVGLVEAKQGSGAIRQAHLLGQGDGICAPDQGQEVHTRHLPHGLVWPVLQLEVPGDAPAHNLRESRERLRCEQVVLDGHPALCRPLSDIRSVLLPGPAVRALQLLQCCLHASLLLGEKASLRRLEVHNALPAGEGLPQEAALHEPHLFTAVGHS